MDEANKQQFEKNREIRVNVHMGRLKGNDEARMVWFSTSEQQ
jgi:hypothetical protein